jgi:hypothetical protein
MPDPLVPPAKWAHLKWHWIVIPASVTRGEPRPTEWCSGGFWRFAGHGVSQEQAALEGWRYHSPCDPAAVTLGEASVEIVARGIDPDAWRIPDVEDIYRKGRSMDAARRAIAALKTNNSVGTNSALAPEV